MEGYTLWAIVGDLLISVNGPGMIQDDRYAQFIHDMRTKPIRKYFAGAIGKTEASSLQRKQAAEIMKSRGIRCAVVTDDGMTRGLVTAISWLGANLKAFSWNDVGSAVKYLDVQGQSEQLVLDELGRLQAAVMAAVNK